MIDHLKNRVKAVESVLFGVLLDLVADDDEFRREGAGHEIIGSHGSFPLSKKVFDGLKDPFLVLNLGEHDPVMVIAEMLFQVLEELA